MADAGDQLTPGVITDRSGNTLDVLYKDGFPFVDLSPMVQRDTLTHLTNIRNMDIRDDDVIMCAFSKAGTHWIWEVIHMLRNKTTQYQKQTKEKQMVEFCRSEDMAAQPSPRVLNTHFWVKHLPKQIFEKKTKIIHLVRNPKDTVVSLYFHFIGLQAMIKYTGEMKDFFDLFMNKQMPFGTWFDYEKQWEEFTENSGDHPIFDLAYEDMIANPVHYVKELSKFLNMDVTEEFAQEIADACSFQKLKKASEEYKDDQLKNIWVPGMSMYRKGKVGDWKNYFTVAENEEYNKVIREKLKDSKLRSKYCTRPYMAEVVERLIPGVITDRSGNTLNVWYKDGFPFTDFSAMLQVDTITHLTNIRNMDMRDDDVIMCAYSKAGTHWIWEVIHMLRNKTTRYQKQTKEKQMLEFCRSEDMAAQPSPRVLNTHFWVRHLPKQIFEKKTKIIHLVRNPKDTAVSLYFHFIGLQAMIKYTGEMKDFFDLFMNKQLPFGTWFEYEKQWEEFTENSGDHPIFDLAYEDMIANPVHYVKELAKFINIEVTDKFAQEIADACSFQKMKKASEEYKDDHMKNLWVPGMSMYRKGKVGDWKNYFTVAEDEDYEKVIQDKLKDSKLRFKYCSNTY